MSKKKNEILVPAGVQQVLLHACCAPCSSAIVEWMLQHDIRPTIFYFNPNIFPREEYDIRKEESKRHAESLGLQWIDGDYDHQRWLEAVRGLEGEPERGSRCRWKSLEQITEAGLRAQAAVPGTTFWAQNWRKGGLQDRRNQLLREYAFYNQQYCGCEFSMR